jgi:hypothetical protein
MSSFITDTYLAEDETSQPYEIRRWRTKNWPTDSPPGMTRPIKLFAPGILTTTPPTFTTHLYDPFSVLPVDPVPQAQQTQAQPEEISKPPPIFIKKRGQLQPVMHCPYWNSRQGQIYLPVHFTLVIVRTSDPDSYRGVVWYLKAQNASFHTISVIRGLHHTTPSDAIHKEHEENGFNVRAVTNALHPSRKLLSHFVDLDPSLTYKSIYNTKNLYFSKVRIE